MSDLIFIADVIYHLKREYGVAITITTVASTIPDRTTGTKVESRSSFSINQAIALPVNMRAKFLRSIERVKAGFLEHGDREFLIDKIDVPPGRIINVGDRLAFAGFESDIKQVDDYQYAYSVTVKQIAGMPT